MFLKEIQIGQLIKMRVDELELEASRISSFIGCTENEMQEMYSKKDISTDILLRWSKLLEYDFFRLYSGHLVLYSPKNNVDINKKSTDKKLPEFRKNIYTKEIIDFILNQIETGKKTKKAVVEQYNIPKNTLYRWITKAQRINIDEKRA